MPSEHRRSTRGSERARGKNKERKRSCLAAAGEDDDVDVDGAKALRSARFVAGEKHLICFRKE